MYGLYNIISLLYITFLYFTAVHVPMTALSCAGTLYIQMERYSEAERNLKQALQLNPDHYGAANNLKVLDYQRARSRRS